MRQVNLDYYQRGIKECCNEYKQRLSQAQWNLQEAYRRSSVCYIKTFDQYLDSVFSDGRVFRSTRRASWIRLGTEVSPEQIERVSAARKTLP